MAEILHPVPAPDVPAASAGAEAGHEPFDFADVPMLLARLGRWCRANPVHALLIAGVLGVVGYFYFGVKAFLGGHVTAASWIAGGWNEENDQQHCWGIIPVAIALLCIRWRQIAAALKTPSNLGMLFVALGVMLFVAGIRCSEARYTILALPFLFYGGTRFLFGAAVGRLVLFPCVFLLFMVPMGGVVQGTVPLQVMTAKAIQILSTIFGIPIQVDGSNITSTDGRFEPMEVAGGCSGIRSLMAMMTLAALYANFTMRGPIRGLVLFAGSLVFAVLGNFARVFSVVIFARFLDPKTATGLYHDYSGFVFFPVAVLAMAGFGGLLNRDWPSTFQRWFPAAPEGAGKNDTPAPLADAPAQPPGDAEPKERLPYDY
jgi:exosortase